MTSRRLYIVNQSTLVTTSETKKMVAAINIQLRDHFSPAWGTQRRVVEFHSGDLASVQNEVPVGSWVMAILDNSDQAGALGWHSVDDKNRVYSHIFAEPSIKQGGSTALSGPYAVSATASHEACETDGDPSCNLYADSGRGFLVAYEDCDPVEADTYEIDGVAVSNFVYPAWFDPYATDGEQLDYLRKCTQPFSMTKGGYWVQMPSGKETEKFSRTVDWMQEVGFDVRENGTVVFSPEMPEWKRELKLAAGRNSIKRSLSGART